MMAVTIFQNLFRSITGRSPGSGIDQAEIIRCLNCKFVCFVGSLWLPFIRELPREQGFYLSTMLEKGVYMNLNQHVANLIKTIRNFSELRNARGFSLIELLIVMIILGLLASLVGPRMFGKLGMAKQKTAKTQIEMLMTALDSYRLDVGKYPSGQDGLEGLVNSGGDKWDGPYLPKGKEVPNDPWDNPYLYQNPGEHGEVDIISLGADGQSGGEGEDADVGSWE